MISVACDACSLLNVLATGSAAQILGNRLLVLAPKVLEEALYIYADDARSSRTTIDSIFLNEQGIRWMKAELDEAERILAVRYSLHVDDGEAEAIAIAISRSIPLFSDDIAAGRVAANHAVIETTLNLIRDWSIDHSEAELRAVLFSLRKRASFAPPRQSPLREWFIDATS